MSEPREFDAMAHLLGVDKLIHEPARLLILSLLRVVKRADFVFLQRQTGMTGGNMSSHVRKLAEAGYVEVEKGFSGNRPQTMLSLTAGGRKALTRYLGTMRAVLEEIA